MGLGELQVNVTLWAKGDSRSVERLLDPYFLSWRNGSVEKDARFDRVAMLVQYGHVAARAEKRLTKCFPTVSLSQRCRLLVRFSSLFMVSKTGFAKQNLMTLRSAF
jgi:hypothetical protein